MTSIDNERRLIVVTPTHKRPPQIPDLVRLKQTLQWVPNCDWVVVEDSPKPNLNVYNYIKDFAPG